MNTNNIEKKPKKRGRKPKKQVEKNDSPMKKSNIEENLVIKLTNKKEIQTIEDVLAYDNVCENEVIQEKNKKHSELCWNCCHSFNSLIVGTPVKYHNKLFYCYGDFCSLECATRYSYEYFPSEKFWEIYPLINLYNHIIFNNDTKIKLAPSKLVLKVFGGDKTIEEYRDLFSSQNIQELKLAPIIPIYHESDIYEKQIQNDSVYKLFRKTPLSTEKKNIKKSMNLVINS